MQLINKNKSIKETLNWSLKTCEFVEKKKKIINK